MDGLGGGGGGPFWGWWVVKEMGLGRPGLVAAPEESLRRGDQHGRRHVFVPEYVVWQPLCGSLSREGWA